MSSVSICCIESCKDNKTKQKKMHEKVCPNFCHVVYFLIPYYYELYRLEEQTDTRLALRRSLADCQLASSLALASPWLRWRRSFQLQLLGHEVGVRLHPSLLLPDLYQRHAAANALAVNAQSQHAASGYVAGRHDAPPTVSKEEVSAAVKMFRRATTTNKTAFLPHPNSAFPWEQIYT